MVLFGGAHNSAMSITEFYDPLRDLVSLGPSLKIGRYRFPFAIYKYPNANIFEIFAFGGIGDQPYYPDRVNTTEKLTIYACGTFPDMICESFSPTASPSISPFLEPSSSPTRFPVYWSALIENVRMVAFIELFKESLVLSDYEMIIEDVIHVTFEVLSDDFHAR